MADQVSQAPSGTPDTSPPATLTQDQQQTQQPPQTQAQQPLPSPFPPPLNPQVQQAPQHMQQVQAQQPPVPQSQQAQDDAFLQAAMRAIQAIAARMPAQAPSGTPTAKRQKYSFAFAEDYFSQKQFDRDIAERKAGARMMTGYANLDAIQPFYPGLYILGAIASLGKTTFAMQMANQLAEAGHYVLYLCLEQTQLDFYSKSLARCFFQTRLEDARANAKAQGFEYRNAIYFHEWFSSYPAPTAVDIWSERAADNYPSELARQVDRYTTAVQNRVCVIQGDFGVMVEDVRYVTELFIHMLGVKPVVIVDYLQIMAPTPEKGRIPDTRRAVEHIVQALKSMQADHGLAVLAISSVNRQNYLAPIDFESFKESGLLEYSSDVVLGLQLEIMNRREFYNKFDANGNEGKETGLTYRRKLVKQAKAENPRHIQLVCLKNRYGRSSFEADFLYFPAHDYFHPVIDDDDAYPIEISPDGDLVQPGPPDATPPGGAGGPLLATGGTAGRDMTAEEQASMDELNEILASNNCLKDASAAPGSTDSCAAEGDIGNA